MALRALLRQSEGVNTLDLRRGTVRGDLSVPNIECRAVANGTGGTRLNFTGYASITDFGYPRADFLGDYTETVRPGAFAKTLAEGADIHFQVNHAGLLADAEPMARRVVAQGFTPTLRVDEHRGTGLWTDADLDGGRDDVYRLQSMMEAGEMSAMSMGFWVTQQRWSPDYEQRDILEVDMNGGDVSAVTYPANPATTGTTTLRAAAAQSLLSTRVPALVAQRVQTEMRAGAKLSSATMEVLQQVLTLISSADEAVDAAQPLLAALMGVPNPDIDAAAPVEAPQTTVTGPDPAAVRERLRLLASA
jgi:hypothetical protein